MAHEACDLRELETWFERAVGAEAGERDGVIAAAPASMRLQLQQLMDHLGKGIALEHPRWVRPWPPPPAHSSGAILENALPAGTRAGPFVLQEPIGCGGMGMVYRAIQDHPRREVAVKVLSTPFATPSALRRFEREVEALARLSHPSIVPVYGAGVISTAHGSAPFFAMELVRGVPLASWIENRRTDGAVWFRDRLELIGKVCDAVEHAHQRGVLHRDLKPANILVESDGRPRVVDFGVARLLDPEEHAEVTLDRGVLGTLGYMSPEQLLTGVADTRSDVYALGIVAWILLTGTHPYGTSPHSLEKALQLAKDRTRPSSAATRGLSRDAAAVLCAAVDPDPDARYQGAGEFAADLRRLAAGRPVRAKTPTIGYLASTFARRHPWQTAALGLAVTAGIVLIALVVVYGESSRREGERALQANELAQRRLDRQRRFIMQSLVTTSYRLQGVPGGHTIHGDLLRDAVTWLDEMATDAGDDLDLLCDLSEALVMLGHSAAGLGTPNSHDPETAARCMERGMAMAERAAAMQPDAKRPLVALEKAVWGLASLPSGVERRPEYYARCVQIQRRVYESFGRTVEDAFRLAYRLMALGACVHDVEILREAVQMYEDVLAQDPGNWEYRVATGTCYGTLANVLSAADPARSLEAAGRSLGLLEPALSAQPANYSCARHLAYCHLARLQALVLLKRFDEAVGAGRAGVQLMAAHANDPSNTVHALDRANVCVTVVNVVESTLNSGDEVDLRSDLIGLVVEAVEIATSRDGFATANWPVTLMDQAERVEALASQWRRELDSEPPGAE
jgi:tetratricopeptide (TPR) repeat protein